MRPRVALVLKRIFGTKHGGQVREKLHRLGDPRTVRRVLAAHCIVGPVRCRRRISLPVASHASAPATRAGAPSASSVQAALASAWHCTSTLAASAKRTLSGVHVWHDDGAVSVRVANAP